MRVQIHWFPLSNRCNKNLVSIRQVNKQTLHHLSITQMVIREGGKCLNVRERVEV